MILNCPSCATKFTIDPQILGAKGRTVRCARCKHQWHVAPPLITLPGDDGMFPGSDGAAAFAPSAVVFAGAEPDTALLKKTRRNSVIAAVLAATLMAMPVLVWRVTALGHDHAAAVQKEIMLEGTPSTKLLQQEGRNVLKIEGTLVNNAKARHKVPRLVAQGMNAKGHVVKEWAIPLTAEEMEPGQRLPFSYTTPFSEQGVVDIAFHFM